MLTYNTLNLSIWYKLPCPAHAGSPLFCNFLAPMLFKHSTLELDIDVTSSKRNVAQAGSPRTSLHTQTLASFVQQVTLANLAATAQYTNRWMQMVERYDRGVLPRQDFSDSYSSLYKLVQKALFRTHVEGQLKADIIQEPSSYVELDPDMAKTLLDQRAAVSSRGAAQPTWQYLSCNVAHIAFPLCTATA